MSSDMPQLWKNTLAQNHWLGVTFYIARARALAALRPGASATTTLSYAAGGMKRREPA